METALNTHDDICEKRTYTVAEIGKLLGISRNAAYTFVNTETGFKSVRIGASIRISKKSFDEWLDRQEL